LESGVEFCFHVGGELRISQGGSHQSCDSQWQSASSEIFVSMRTA
jgi:hypothetical protein